MKRQKYHMKKKVRKRGKESWVTETELEIIELYKLNKHI